MIWMLAFTDQDISKFQRSYMSGNFTLKAYDIQVKIHNIMILLTNNDLAFKLLYYLS
jgi:hypothetical protein